MEKDIRYVDLTDKELAKQLKTTVRTMKKTEKSLIEKGIMEYIEIDGKIIRKYYLYKLLENE